MSNGPAPTRDALDDKVNRLFAGKVVRKDLVRKVKVGANVPVFVLEFLLGKYCASSDEMAIQMGLQVVNDTLANNYIRPDESMKAQSKVKDRGPHTFIDKVKVRLVDSDYWAEVTNFGHKNVHVPEHYVRDYERLVMGGVWAQVDMRFEYDEENRRARTRSGSTSSRRSRSHLRPRGVPPRPREFTTDEWLDLIMRSMGYEPTEMSRRLKLLFLVRLIPLAERNYNLVELGPRGTGKSYVVQEVSPYSALLTGRHHGGQPLRPHERPPEGHGADLGRRRLRRGRRPAEDAEGGHHHDEDLLRVRHLPARAGGGLGRREHRAVRQHQPARRRDGADRPPLRADARHHPRRHGVHRPPALLPPRLGDPEDAQRPLHRPLRLRGRLPGRGAPRAAQAQLHRDHRPPLLAGRAPQRPRPQGRAQDRLGPDEDPLPARRGRRRRSWPSSSSSPRGPAPREGAAQEDGLLRVLPHVLQLHGQRDRRGEVRRRARAGRARPHLHRPAGRPAPSTRRA
jgi:hypothetical protein